MIFDSEEMYKGFFGTRVPNYFRYKPYNSQGGNRIDHIERLAYIDPKTALDAILRVQKIAAHPYLDSLSFVLMKDDQPCELYMTCLFPSLDSSLGNIKDSENIISIIGQVGSAVEYLHTNQVTHNAVTAANILVNWKSSVETKLSGFEKCKELKYDDDRREDHEAMAALAELLYNTLYRRDKKREHIFRRDMLMDILETPPLSDALDVLDHNMKELPNIHIDINQVTVPQEFHTASHTYKEREFMIKYWESSNFHHQRREPLTDEKLVKLKMISKQAHLVTVFGYAYVEEINSGFLMELAAGLPEGFNVLRSDGLESRIFQILAEHIALGLQFLGKLGFVHGAIRPEHVVFNPSKRFQICSLDSIHRKERDTMLSFLAPELFNSPAKSKDPRSDIYSLGAMLSTVLQGRAPYASYQATSSALVEAIESGDIGPFSDITDRSLLELVKGCCQPIHSRWSIETVLEAIRDLGEVTLTPYTADSNTEPPWILPLNYRRGTPIEEMYTRRGKTYSRVANQLFPEQVAKKSEVLSIKQNDVITVDINRKDTFSPTSFKIYLKYSTSEYHKRQVAIIRGRAKIIKENRKKSNAVDDTFWCDTLQLHINASILLETCFSRLQILKSSEQLWIFVDGVLKELYDSLTFMDELRVEIGDDVRNLRIQKGEKAKLGQGQHCQMIICQYVCSELFRHYLPKHELDKAVLDKRYGTHTFFFRENKKIFWTSRKINTDEVIGVLLKTYQRGKPIGMQYKRSVHVNDYLVTFMFSAFPSVGEKDPGKTPQHRMFHLRINQRKTEVLMFIKGGYLIVIQNGEIKYMRAFEEKPMFLTVNTAYHQTIDVDVQLFSRVQCEDGSFLMDCWPREQLGVQDEGNLIRPRRIQYDIRELPQINVENISSKKAVGHGNFSEVYTGKCHLGSAAFKIHKEKISEAEIIDEIKTLSGLKSPHFVKFLAVLKSNEKIAGVVLEAMHGDLEKVIRDTRREYDDIVICRWLYQIAEGLDYLHQREKIHRDLKPANILVKDSSYQCVKLADFGSLVDTNQTTSKNGITRKYCDPTVLEADSRTSYHPSFDIYSLGVTIWDTFHRNTIHENFPSKLAEKKLRQVDWTDIITRCTADARWRPTAADISLEAQCLLLSMQ